MRPRVLLAALLVAMPLVPALPAAPAPEPAWWEQPLGIPEPRRGGGPGPAVLMPVELGDDVVVAVNGNQNEFSIAANPRDPNHLVAGANDYSRGDAWAGVYVSFDGGQTWSHDYIPLPALYTVSGDPAIDFGPNGEVYYAGIAFNRGATNNGANAIFVSKSVDGGLTWSTVTPFTSPASSPAHDKPYIDVDASGAVYLTYTHFGANGGISFSKSLDGGATWTPRVVLGSGQFSLPVASTLGTHIYVTWAGGGARFARSLDGGLTWAVSTPLALGIGSVPVPFRIFAYPVMAVATGGAHPDRIYLAAPQSNGATTDLAVIHSDDHGASWSEPTELVRPGVQFQPWMAIQPDGTVGIAYMDTVLAPTSYVGTPTGAVIGATVLLSQSLSILRPDPALGALGGVWTTQLTTDLPSRADTTIFWGDYQGLAATSEGFHPAFGDARGALTAFPCGCVAPAPLDFGTMRVVPTPVLLPELA